MVPIQHTVPLPVRVVLYARIIVPYLYWYGPHEARVKVCTSSLPELSAYLKVELSKNYYRIR